MLSSRLLRSLAKNRAGSAAAVMRSLGTYKTSTGLVGLDVDPDGRNTLLNISAQVLKSVKKIPEDSQYRVDVEKWFNFIANVAAKHEDIRKIEDEIDLGQIEEVVEMAKSELELIDDYYNMKGWEAVAEAQRDAAEVERRMADSIYFSSPQCKPV